MFSEVGIGVGPRFALCQIQIFVIKNTVTCRRGVMLGVILALRVEHARRAQCTHLKQRRTRALLCA